MGDSLTQTIQTYERTAKGMAEYFRRVKSVRSEDIDKAFELLGNRDNPVVLEIGCADGRDAAYIAQKTKSYIGIDPVPKFIEMAKANVPDGSFEIADARNFKYPKGLDIIFAFASLLHFSKEENQKIFDTLAGSLIDGGVFYISLKNGKYESYIKEDQYGKRLFYLYNPAIIKELAGQKYETIFVQNTDFMTGDGTEWFEIALRRK